jgi:hypothetical protein
MADEVIPVIMLGNKVKDIITSVEGIAFARANHLYGCTHIYIKPTTLDEKGQVRDSLIVDLARCEFVAAALGQPDGPPPEPALGKVVSDPITGFEGVVMITLEQLYGPVEVCVESRKLSPDGKVVIEWFDGPRLKVIDEFIPAAAAGSIGSSSVKLPAR